MIETLGNLGDFIGGIAVVVTLIYLAVQVRQSTRATRVASMVDIMGTSQNANIHVSAPLIPRVVAKLTRGERLAPEEFVAFRFHIQGMLTNQWQVFYLSQHGMVEKSVRDAWERRNTVFFEMPLFQAGWQALRAGYPEDFQAYMDQEMARHRTRGASGESG